MSFGNQHNIGASIVCAHGSDNATQVAAGSGDNTQVVGQIIDRTLFNYPLSMIVAIRCKAVLATTAKLTLKSVTVEHGDASNLSDAASFATPADADVLVDPGGGSTMRTVKEYDVDLGGAKRYIRVKYTPDLSAGSVDTAENSVVVIFGGLDTVPA
jgi:hypothetical protein